MGFYGVGFRLGLLARLQQGSKKKLNGVYVRIELGKILCERILGKRKFFEASAVSDQAKEVSAIAASDGKIVNSPDKRSFELSVFFPLLTALLLVVACLTCPVWSKGDNLSKPLKVIAPDLIVESCEFGKFPFKHGPMDEVPPEQVKFIPCNVATGRGYSYGYRLVIKTPRKQVHWTHVVGASPGVDPKNAQPRKAKAKEVKDGVFYFNFPIVAGFGKGKYWIKVFVEGESLPVMYYTVE